MEINFGVYLHYLPLELNPGMKNILVTGWRVLGTVYWVLVEDPVFKRGYLMLDVG